MNLNGAGVLVTGASSGIGLATARALFSKGARLAVAGRDRQRLADLAAEVGGTAIVADLTADESITRCVDEAANHLGAIDILVNNAGVGWTGAFAHMPAIDIDHLIRLNLRAAILLARELTPPMIARGRGHIVNVASIAGHLGVGGEAVYSATKAALINFSEGLRQEVADSGVGVAVVSPGVVATEFFNRHGSPYLRSWPRPITPEAVADVIVRSIETNRPEAIVPKWLGLVARLKGSLPGVYRALNRRFG
ncbi:MAG: SDR family NAD(P)-dependent oxidoreductase [Chloroflexi bacterium]|nr:SDR family NAD(P)-dependent oxidoreductase [Chloroflexota bacterium]MCY3937946.1 SDR family NAD(P)-dependent oxidoreductase [Chloroflexota bacterium]